MNPEMEMDNVNPNQNNYAFIDTQNLHQAAKQWGWKLDYGKLREFMRERYAVKVAYLFVGFLQDNVEMYSNLQKLGYVLVFKEALEVDNHVVKGNCDVDLALQVMIDWNNYDQAIIVSADGDFSSLVRYLNNQNKLSILLVPSRSSYSQFLKKSSRGKIGFLNLYRAKLKTDDDFVSAISNSPRFIRSNFEPVVASESEKLDKAMDKEIAQAPKIDNLRKNKSLFPNNLANLNNPNNPLNREKREISEKTLQHEKKVENSENEPVTVSYKDLLSKQISAMRAQKRKDRAISSEKYLLKSDILPNQIENDKPIKNKNEEKPENNIIKNVLKRVRSKVTLKESLKESPPVQISIE